MNITSSLLLCSLRKGGFLVCNAHTLVLMRKLTLKILSALFVDDQQRPTPKMNFSSFKALRTLNLLFFVTFYDAELFVETLENFTKQHNSA